jgi:diguanylate cyclase (GGDEF)-like protein
MRLDMILMMGAAFAASGTLLGWLTLWPSFRRQARDLRMGDWNLAHLRAEQTEQQQLFDTLMESGPQVVIRLDAAGHPVYVSPSCRPVLGYTPSDIRLRAAPDLMHPATDTCIRVRHRDGQMLALRSQRWPLPDGHGAALVLTDVTAHSATDALLAEARGQLKQRATRDSLTGLANRAYFLESLDCALDENAGVAVLLVDLDRFRPVNDQYGHETGDRLLQEVAARLTLTMVGEPLVARLGDDDFAVLLRATEGDAPIAARARDLIRLLELPIPTGSLTVEIGASIGIAVGPRDGTRAGALLRAADIAMIHARASGGATYRFFETRMGEALARADELRRELPAAIAAGQIVPYFQPLVRMADTAIVGFEVLARWLHPVHGTLPPAEFLPLVEECGLSAKMFQSILTRSCQAALDWPADIKLSVNISPIELQDEDLPDTVRDILITTGFQGDRLEVEITENALVHDARIARDVLDRLRLLGLTVALDDFGTGYSSLYHLRELPFDKVKIDKAFMRNLDTDPEASRYVAAIIDFGHALGLDLTAEGIENTATHNRLRELGCTFGQGYLFGRPMPVEQAQRILMERCPAELAAD